MKDKPVSRETLDAVKSALAAAGEDREARQRELREQVEQAGELKAVLAEREIALTENEAAVPGVDLAREGVLAPDTLLDLPGPPVGPPRTLDQARTDPKLPHVAAGTKLEAGDAADTTEPPSAVADATRLASGTRTGLIAISFAALAGLVVLLVVLYRNPDASAGQNKGASATPLPKPSASEVVTAMGTPAPSVSLPSTRTSAEEASSQSTAIQTTLPRTSSAPIKPTSLPSPTASGGFTHWEGPLQSLPDTKTSRPKQ